MTNTIARIRVGSKTFEILVEDIDKAFAFKKGEGVGINEFLAIDKVFLDSKKGLHAGDGDLEEGFGTKDINEIVTKIIKHGELELPQEYRNKAQGEKFKQVVDFLVRNSVEPVSGRPYTPDRIESVLKEAGVNITNNPIESQIKGILEKISPIIPIKVETKKIKLTIPAQYTGAAYGIIQTYKESEEWLDNGDLKCIISIPVGLQMDFYDKLNSLTHGAVLSEEIIEKEE